MKVCIRSGCVSFITKKSGNFYFSMFPTTSFFVLGYKKFVKSLPSYSQLASYVFLWKVGFG